MATKLHVDATIVIPQYGQPELTVACVQTLRQWEPRRWPVVVVDDGSPTLELNRTEDSRPDVTIIEQAHSGVTRAWNAGAARVATPFIVLLNNDTCTTGPWVDALLEPLRKETAILTGLTWRTERAVPPETASKLPTTRFVEGWCCAVSVARLREVGGFDEALTLYFSDTDLQARLVRAFGSESLAVVNGVQQFLRHRGHASTRLLPERRAVWAEDRRRFITKWSGE